MQNAAYHCVYIEKEIDISNNTSEYGAKFIQILKFVPSMLQKERPSIIKKLWVINTTGITPFSGCKGRAGLDILCQVLSENRLHKDLAGTVWDFMVSPPQNVQDYRRGWHFENQRYVKRTRPVF